MFKNFLEKFYCYKLYFRNFRGILIAFTLSKFLSLKMNSINELSILVFWANCRWPIIEPKKTLPTVNMLLYVHVSGSTLICFTGRQG